MIVCLIEREREREKKSTKYASINTQFIRRNDIEYEKKSVLFSMYKKKYEARGELSTELDEILVLENQIGSVYMTAKQVLILLFE